MLASYDVFVNIFKFLNETTSLFGPFHVFSVRQQGKPWDASSWRERSWDVTVQFQLSVTRSLFLDLLRILGLRSSNEASV